MNRRPSVTAVALATAFVLTLTYQATPARADALPANGTGVARYRLTSDVDLPPPDPNASGPQVVLDVTNGQIVPPAKSDGSTSSPLTILSSSNGLDQNNMIVGLKEAVSNGNGSPTQLFGISFFKDGLLSAANNGHLDFELTVNPALPTPTLKPESSTLHVALLDSTPPPTTPPTGGNPGAQVPEPASLAVWSAVAGLGLLRVRAVRRRRAASA